MAVKSNKQKNGSTKQTNGSILYLQDVDAKALGIIEGSAQKVFVDGREINVAFVDEHEVIPASLEEKKLYQDAAKIAAKYESVYGSEDLNLRRNLVGNKNGNLKSHTFKSLFSPKMKERTEFESTPVAKKSRLFSKTSNDKVSKLGPNDPRNCATNEILSHAELDIIQGIITKSKTQAVAKQPIKNAKAITTLKKPVKTAVSTNVKKPVVKTNAIATVKKTKKPAPKNNSK